MRIQRLGIALVTMLVCALSTVSTPAQADPVDVNLLQCTGLTPVKPCVSSYTFKNVAYNPFGGIVGTWNSLYGAIFGGLPVGAAAGDSLSITIDMGLVDESLLFDADPRRRPILRD